MKNSVVFGLIIAILVGGVFLLSKKQVNSPTTSTSTNQSLLPKGQEDSMVENATYGHVHAILINPPDNSLLLGTHYGLFKSTDQGKTFQKVDVKGEVNATDFMNFAYDQNNKIIYAGGHDLGVVKSIDGGLTWTKTDSGIKGSDIHALAINPLDTTRLYAFSVGNGVFGTKDGAKSWYRIDDGPANPSVVSFGYMATPSSMDRSMRVDKTTNIGYLWAGTGGGLFSSFACFCGWTPSQGISSSVTVYALAADPLNKSAMLLAQKDGIYKTTDEGKTFTQISTEVKDVGALWFDIENPKLVFAATNSGVIYSSNDSGMTWSKIQ